MNAMNMTRDGIVSALTLKPGLLPQTKPQFLRDVLRMKRARSDTDADYFKAISKDFAYGLNATISGAAWAMRQWVAKGEKLGWSEMKIISRKAFLADLDAVLSGDLTGWDVKMGAA